MWHVESGFIGSTKARVCGVHVGSQAARHKERTSNDTMSMVSAECMWAQKAARKKERMCNDTISIVGLCSLLQQQPTRRVCT